MIHVFQRSITSYDITGNLQMACALASASQDRARFTQGRPRTRTPSIVAREAIAAKLEPTTPRCCGIATSMWCTCVSSLVYGAPASTIAVCRRSRGASDARAALSTYDRPSTNQAPAGADLAAGAAAELVQEGLTTVSVFQEAILSTARSPRQSRGWNSTNSSVRAARHAAD